MRICFNVDRTTHRYFIEELSDSLHPKVMLCSRYASFHQSLLTCDKFPIRYLARLYENDQRTVFGKTLRRIHHECSSGTDTTLPPFPSKNLVKKKMKYFAVPDNETWRLSLLHDLLGARKDKSVMPGFSAAEIEEMLAFVCTS